MKIAALKFLLIVDSAYKLMGPIEEVAFQGRITTLSATNVFEDPSLTGWE
jgi:hypothetical protein